MICFDRVVAGFQRAETDDTFIVDKSFWQGIRNMYKTKIDPGARLSVPQPSEVVRPELMRAMVGLCAPNPITH